MRANVSLALQLCLSPGNDGIYRAAQFRAAGFSERVDRSTTNSDTTHYFSAPADTAQVELYYGEMPDHCFVSANHLDVSDAAGILDSVVPRLFPGYVRKVTLGTTNPTTGQPAQCVSYEDPTNPIGHVVGASPGGNASSCTDNGTSQFYSTYRV